MSQVARPFESSLTGSPILEPSSVNCTVPVGTGERYPLSHLRRILVVDHRERGRARMNLLADQSYAGDHTPGNTVMVRPPTLTSQAEPWARIFCNAGYAISCSL